MTSTDDRILEYLADEGWATPALIGRETALDVSEGYIDDRLQFLRYAGLVAHLHGDTYEATKWGLMYLSGELDAHHQPTPTVDRVFCGGSSV